MCILHIYTKADVNALRRLKNKFNDTQIYIFLNKAIHFSP